MKTLRPLGKSKWVKAHWHYDYHRRQWEWVEGPLVRLAIDFEDDKGADDQKDAEGFIRLNAPRLRTLGFGDRNNG